MTTTTSAAPKLTQAVVKAALGAIGVSFRSRDGEFRLNFRDGTEATAAYTGDLADALDTGRAMVAHRAR